ncbi:uncharacterized protein SAPINGB_P003341 [Magnusiomyces paraingens]|uniref:Ribosome assembly protein 1 n=1 Tax=Magnusiomyces paraingens TaxID=2606893 RepID=A0A5E8BWA4_9ASCO|nr:uncharacterized protein SAPINGB_P003341 [Saprochaete ingens]VVT52975.1 unnamed protein product [Saprochaete ingens]
MIRILTKWTFNTGHISTAVSSEIKHSLRSVLHFGHFERGEVTTPISVLVTIGCLCDNMVNPETLKRLQSHPDLIRNICILAHVDHGKTTLSDSLLASNGIISQNMAGKLRYLDSRPDEQIRGITMESSAISLYFKVASRSPPLETNGPQIKEYLINLIDSPGHIDFSSEVSTASRLCDGALVLVDAVEGVLSQTVTVLRQAWVEKLKPVLVINKIDRLVTELRLTPMEAYIHLTRLIEQVNAVMGSFFAVDRMQEDLKWRELQEQKQNSGDDKKDEFVEKSDDDLYFNPELNNIIFASAIDGWGFNISQFASIFERKLGIQREKLEKVLWGNYYFDPKTKRVLSAGSSAAKTLKNPKPLFVQLVLDNIWKIYKSSVVERDSEQSSKIVSALNLKISPAMIKAKDGKPLLTAIFNQWIPISVSILLSVIEKVNPPTIAQRERIPLILESAPGGGDGLNLKVRDAMLCCDRLGPVVSYVSKVIAIPEEEILRKKSDQEEKENNRTPMSAIQERTRRARELAANLQQGPSDMVAAGGKGYDDEEDIDDLDAYFNQLRAESPVIVKEKLIGFARVFSGTLKVGQELYILQPKFDPANPEKHREKIVISDLFLLMGRELVSLKEVPAGNIVGIGGLDGKILKNGTLVSLEHGQGPNLASRNNIGAPIVRVAVEPVDPTKLDQLENGLKLLNLSDPMVQVSVAENGAHILMTAGELHLERCLKDLKERFAKVDIQASEPIVPYRETIVGHKGVIEQTIGNTTNTTNTNTTTTNIDEDIKQEQGVGKIDLGGIRVRLRVEPLASEITKFLTDNHEKIEALVREYSKNGIEDTWIQKAFSESVNESASRLKSKDNAEKLRNALSLENIVAFGPRRTGSNILVDRSGVIRHRLFKQEHESKARFAYEESIVTGFQLATQHGPLTAEPMEGVMVVVDSVVEEDEAQESNETETREKKDKEEATGGDRTWNMNVSGRLISATKEKILTGFLDWSPRLLLAMYECQIQAPGEVLGKVYGVLSRRRGKVLQEEMREGTPFYLVTASLPVVEAFGFSDDIRKKTSGAANPQLVFSGFEMVVDEDPFWVPTTEEELEKLGETADRENIAKMYMEKVRKRKGLSVAEKVVENAEKQRTLKR